MLFELLTRNYPGMRWWLVQRISAAVMAAYIVLLLARLLVLKPDSYVAWQAFWQPGWWRTLTMTCFLGLVIHAWLGVRDVLRDYVFNTTWREWMQTAVELLLLFYLCWACYILWP